MSDDDTFLQQFEGCTLLYAQWHHRAHLKVAYLYVTRFGLKEAIRKVTSGIRAYNASQGIEDTPTGGYHETMTVAWVQIMAAMLAEYGPAATADAFIDGQPQLWEKKILRLFYSRKCFGSPEAKYVFVPPDLAPLPVACRSELQSQDQVQCGF